VTLVGTSNNDVLNFSGTTLTGIASINGLGGVDTITGSAGDDVIIGGPGSDTLTGGGGSDTFIFDPADTSDDVITDFTTGTDKIDLTAYGNAITFASVTQTGSNPLLITVPTVGAKKIKLTGVASALPASDFIFAV
jgi:Ca2+-binding RTX toxin-like protein